MAHPRYMSTPFLPLMYLQSRIFPLLGLRCHGAVSCHKQHAAGSGNNDHDAPLCISPSSHVMVDSHAAVLLKPGSKVQMPCLHSTSWLSGWCDRRRTQYASHQLHNRILDDHASGAPIVQLSDVHKLLASRILQVRQLHLHRVEITRMGGASGA